MLVSRAGLAGLGACTGLMLLFLCFTKAPLSLLSTPPCAPCPSIASSEASPKKPMPSEAAYNLCIARQRLRQGGPQKSESTEKCDSLLPSGLSPELGEGDEKHLLLTPTAAEQLSKLTQEIFCSDIHPLSMPNTMQVPLLPHKDVIMHVYAGNDVVSKDFANGGQWEEKELKEVLWALDAPLPSGHSRTSEVGKDLFVDVGCNVGAFFMPVLARGYEVVGFEGMQANQHLIRSSLCSSSPKVRSRATLHSFGLGDSPTSCYILSAGKNRGDGISLCGMASKEEAKKELHSDYELRGKMRVEVLDSVFQRDVKVMKIDVEGYEPFVLGGAQRLLENHHVWFIIVEFNPVLLKSALHKTSTPPTDWVKQLHRMGYKMSITSFQGPFLNEQSLGKLDKGDESICNLYCVHKDWPLKLAASSRPGLKRLGRK